MSKWLEVSDWMDGCNLTLAIALTLSGSIGFFVGFAADLAGCDLISSTSSLSAPKQSGKSEPSTVAKYVNAACTQTQKQRHRFGGNSASQGTKSVYDKHWRREKLMQHKSVALLTIACDDEYLECNRLLCVYARVCAWDTNCTCILQATGCLLSLLLCITQTNLQIRHSLFGSRCCLFC